MPDLTVVTPAAVVPADRLTLGSCDARVDSVLAPTVGPLSIFTYFVMCMAEE